ncbi:hypothetical protein BB560_004435 [Smittium megazygosporum]|uniref:Uncharacterized protein n=1 Tax=Smittium megazygosporum TaxID=133381 RepID=A0A2T9Z978_9FUNG|nr:hypothetical protein BB560_006288 [Smittium megazygosporum]PVV01153.1 hypothetical protein BB560_004435 [Smittium megazygosporum]
MSELSNIQPRIREILTNSDLSSVTAKKVRRQLEKDMGVSLSAHKARIDEMIMDQFYKLHDEFKKKQGLGGQFDSPGGGVQVPGQHYPSGAQNPEPKKRGRPPKAQDPTASPPQQRKRRQRRAKRVIDPNKPKRQTGLNKPLRLSPKLSAFFSRKYMPRTDVVKGLWIYIKANNMQDPADKRYILCDQKFNDLFDTDRLYMYTMNKQLNDHLIKLEPHEVEAAEAEVSLHNPPPIEPPVSAEPLAQ